jgi:hypothetical protein
MKKRKAAAPKGPRSSKRARRPARREAPRPAPRAPDEPTAEGEVTELAEELAERQETSPRLTAGDVDADWRSAHAVGEEAAGGSVATPDQDIVDEIGEALGVPQASDAEVRTSDEILRERDRDRWRLEREAAREEE